MEQHELSPSAKAKTGAKVRRFFILDIKGERKRFLEQAAARAKGKSGKGQCGRIKNGFQHNHHDYQLFSFGNRKKVSEHAESLFYDATRVWQLLMFDMRRVNGRGINAANAFDWTIKLIECVLLNECGNHG